MEKTVRVDKTETGMRLDVFLSRKTPDISRSAIQKMIKSGLILLNGKAVAPHHAVDAGDVVALDAAVAAPKTSALTPRTDISLAVVYEDADLAVINKQAGLLVHPSVLGEDDTLANALIVRYPEIAGVGESWERPGIMHRLDKDASGLLVVARNKQAYNWLKKQFQRHAIKKEYQVLVHGRPPKDTGVISLAIGRSRSGVKMAARPQPLAGDKTAVTHYRIDRVFADASLLTVRTETGRTHQIRAHFKALGNPVAGDPLYRMKRLPALPAGRLFLHAKTLGFVHPTTKQKLEFQAPLPAELQQTLDKLRP